ncbi:methyl-CpG-binding domain protein 1a isoform X2 [Brachyhypopomus gauderio]|uniref:methyl-CpG-binding domain protein 1a isoform X2 n=1 Tax=Brachyhypopomus gauderio TaxID=698409 RepID=UPI004041982E
MGDMAEDSKGQSVAGQGQLLGNTLPVAADNVAADEPPPCDWLEPLEEDYEEEGEEGVESDRSSVQSGRKIVDSLRRRKRQHEDWDRNWVDCPDLGQGWKRKEVFRRSGSTMGKMDAYYMSPKGHRFRSKIELAKHVKVDLTHFDYKQGIFVDGFVTTKRRKSEAPEDGTRSSFSSSRTATPDPDTTRTPDRFPTTPPMGPRSKTSTPQRPQLTPNPPAKNAEAALLPANRSFGSPPELTRISLPGTHPPSPRTGKFSPQTLSLVTTSGKGEIMSLPHSWLQSSLSPVSPPRTPNRETAVQPFGRSAVKRSPDFHLPPRTRLALDPDTMLNGRKHQRRGLPTLGGCANCGCNYPGVGRGQDSLCPKCRSEKKRPPHIVFRKVGQDKWVLGKTRIQDPLKKKISPLGKKHHSSKSLKTMSKQDFTFKAFKKVMVQQDSDDDDCVPDAGDDDESGPRRRNRRMCGQCKACLRSDDCGRCDFCMDKPKFGGSNKKRQKCRLRQCQVQSRHQNKHLTRRLPRADKVEDSPRVFQKRGRPPGKRAIKWRSWDDEFTDDEDDDEEEDKHQRMSADRKWRYSLGHEDNKEMAEPEIEDEGPGDLEQELETCEDDGRGWYESEELYSSSYALSAQNGGLVESSGDQNGMVVSSEHRPQVISFTSHPNNGMVVSSEPRPQELFYSMAGLSAGSRVLGSIKLTSSGALEAMPERLVPLPGPLAVPLPGPLAVPLPGPLPSPDIMSAAGSLQLRELLRRNGLELVSVEAATPQLHPGPELVTRQQPEPQPDPESPEAVPMITQIYSLADSMESESVRDQGLLELLRAMRRTTLPPHWVGVMAKGPVLQLFQCSKLSPMADTVLQIEVGYFYQISVQSQPLLPTHAVYERHPSRLETVDQVVALLLDLEELAVCQGCRGFEACPTRGPVLCTRAALCELLIPLDDEHCAKCQPPAED